MLESSQPSEEGSLYRLFVAAFSVTNEQSLKTAGGREVSWQPDTSRNVIEDPQSDLK